MPATPARLAPLRPALVDDASAARQALESERTAVRLASGAPAGERLRGLIRLGLYDDADSLLVAMPERSLEVVAAEAELRFRQRRFADARRLADAVLARQRSHRAARLLSVRLEIQAWRLERAEQEARALLGRRRDAEAAVLIGRIRLLQRDQEGAHDWAERALSWDPRSPGAALLQADIHFWRDEAGAAEAAARRALEAAPFDPDARFAFGYALWRRGAPALLPAMMQQWSLALAADPLHLPSHWHLGNGHTALTWADYASAVDSAARPLLAPAESLFSAGRYDEAAAAAREVGTRLPEALLPRLLRGSAFFALRGTDPAAALDSAQAAFTGLLRAFPEYGPAHNGLAAVLEQREMRALAAYDSLEAVLAGTLVPDVAGFDRLFPQLAPGGDVRTARMVAQQLGPAAALVPLLARLGRTFQILPLHQDLAGATGDPFFRAEVTPDLRRWMDIRGVGGGGTGAVGIEYLERGSHLQRNVFLHELIHLAHDDLFTDAQRRRVRALYREAIRNDRLLDYYSGSTEQEFLAQAVEAYFASTRVHPLDHKSMNTRADLQRVDGELYAFVAELAGEMETALAGEPGALRSMRAQGYLTSALEVRSDVSLGAGARTQRTEALLDSALIHDPVYLPAFIAYAELERDRGRLDAAEAWLQRAEVSDPGYAPIMAARADLVAADPSDLPGLSDTRIAYLRRAAELEEDPVLRAGYFRDLWELYRGLGRVPDAIVVAREYVAIAPVETPRLRGLRDQAAGAAEWFRAVAGDPAGALPFFRDQFAASPHDLTLAGRYAEVLGMAGQREEATGVLEDAQRVLTAAGYARPEITVRLAEIRLAGGDTAAARLLMEGFLRGDPPAPGPEELRLVRLLISLGEATEAHRRLALVPEPRTPAARAELAFTRGWISEWRGDREMAARYYQEAARLDPYHRPAP